MGWFDKEGRYLTTRLRFGNGKLLSSRGLFTEKRSEERDFTLLKRPFRS